MPSHEDYLDSLLNSLTSDTGNEPEAAATDEIIPEEMLSEDILSDEAIPEETLSEDILPDEAIPEETLSEDILPDEAIPEETLSEDILPDEAIPEETLSEDILSNEAIPEELLPEDILSDETTPEETLSEDILSDEAIPEELLPEDILSDEAIPEELLPEDILSDEATPEETLPEDILSDEAIPEETLSEDMLPGDTIPEDLLPEDTLSGEMSLESILPDEMMPEDIIPENIIPEDILPDDKMISDLLSDEIVSDAVPEGNGSVEEIEAELDMTLDTDALLEDAMADLEDVLGPVDDLDIEEMDASVEELTALLENTEESDEEIDKEPMTDLSSTPDLETVSTMSEEEIERFLAASADEGLEQKDAVADAEDGLPGEEDLLGMLESTDDSDLMDIQDMLDKADNNEAVNEEIEALLSGTGITEQSGESGVTEIEDEKTRRAREKKQQRQEKAAAKKAAREAKAAARAAAKEAKAAAKLAGNAGIAAAVAEGISEETNHSPDSDDLFDSSLLDSIVSEADLAGQEDAGETHDFENTDSFSGDIGDIESDPDIENMDTGEAAEEGSGAVDDEDDMGFNMDSLFGDVDDSGLGGSTDSESESAFPDFVDLDGQNLDAIMPEFEENGRKKKGLLARFFDMLTEEDEEEESTSLRLSDENKDILNDLDNEKEAKKKKKKKIKKAAAQGEEEDAEGDKAKGKKEKKAKKPKPEKPKKEPEPEPLIPEKKLTPKKVIPVALVCASLGVLIIVFANASVDYSDRKNARDAYYDGDYQTCYENLFGKDLNETEQIMFGTSKSILYMRLWMSEYEMFVDAGEEIEALDNLIQTVNNYPALYDYAVQWNAGDEVMAGYAVILGILSEKYGLTEEQAKEIAAVRSNYKYTEMVVAIVQGKPFGSWNASVSEDSDQNVEPSPMPDELPEEGELSDGSFIGNN